MTQRLIKQPETILSKMLENKQVIPACIIAVGIAFCGFFPGYYWNKTEGDKLQERNTVVVKGLARKQVKSDLATWNIEVFGNYNDWDAGKTDVEQKTNEVIRFLTQNGLAISEIVKEEIGKTDRFADANDSEKYNRRYKIYQNLYIETEKVDILDNIKLKIGKLRTDEIDISAAGIKYYYFSLNDIKPEMLQEALENAKVAAKKFAEGSGLRVGKIKTASQGTFEISAEAGARGCSYYDSEYCSVNKIVRVVSTIEYYLK